MRQASSAVKHNNWTMLCRLQIPYDLVPRLERLGADLEVDRARCF